MKKIFLSAFALLLIITANAQNERSAAGSAKASTDPMVNGIPYSQYKGQQEALKQAQLKKAAADKASTTQSDPKQGTAFDKPTTAQLQNLEPKSTVTKPAEVTKAAEPTLPAGIINANISRVELPAVAADKPVPNSIAPAKAASSQNIDKSIPGTLVPIPAINMQMGANDAAETTTASQTKLPEVKVNQPAQKVETEIPASVTPAPLKIPAVSKQGGNK